MEENIKASEMVQIIFPNNPDKEAITTYAWRLNIVKEKATHFKNKRWFVKLFQDMPIWLYDVIGSDWKYVIKIIDIIDKKNTFNIKELRMIFWESSQMYRRVKTRLVKKWIIKDDWINWYLNPEIAIKNEATAVELHLMFREDNLKYFNYEYENKSR